MTSQVLLDTTYGQRPTRESPKLDDSAILALDIIDHDGLSKVPLASYDYFVDVEIRQIITEKLQFVSGTQMVLRAIDVGVLPPSRLVGNTPELVGPAIEKLANRSYQMTITVDFERRVRQSDGTYVNTILKNVPIGYIPVMVGSKYCNTRSMLTPEEIGECATVPPGYFVVSGQARIAPISERLRYNQWLLYAGPKKNPVCVFTVSTSAGTDKIALSLEPKIKSINFFMSLFKDNNRSIPVFFVYELFGVTDVSEMINMICRYTQHPGKVQEALTPSMAIYTTSEHRGVKLISRFIDPSLRDKMTEEMMITQFRVLLFQQMNVVDPSGVVVGGDLLTRKIELFSMGMAKYCEFLAGVRGYDERDSYANKALSPIGSNLRTLFSKCIDDLYLAVGNTKNLETSSDDQIKGLFFRPKLTNVINDAVKTGVWGNSQYAKTNVTELMKADSQISYYSQIMRVVRPVGERTKSDLVRKNQRSQVGHVSVSHTPESAKVGLVLNLAAGCSITIPEYEGIMFILESIRAQFIKPQWSPAYPNPFIVNGSLWGHCQSAVVHSVLVLQRRMLFNQLKATIYRSSEGYLFVYTDAERPTRPLLIVDYETQQTVLELYQQCRSVEKLRTVMTRLYSDLATEDRVMHVWNLLNSTKFNLWRATLPELYNVGILEYVDPLELEDGTRSIAQTINHLKIEADLTHQLEKSQQYFATLYQLLASKAPILEVEEFVNSTTNSTDLQTAQMAINSTREESLNAVAGVSVNIESSLKERNKYRRYYYAEIDPMLIMSAAEAAAPYTHHQQAPRTTYQCKMGNQALSSANTMQMLRFETTSKYALGAQVPLVQTNIYGTLGLQSVGTVQNLVIGISPFLGYSIEDSLVLNKRALDMGLCRSIKETTYWGEEKTEGSVNVRLEKPPVVGDPQRYAKLNSNGLPKLGVEMKVGDCLIGLVRHDGKGKTIDVSVYTEFNAEGIVDSVMVTTNEEHKRIIAVKLRRHNVATYGDKMASRFAQKGTIGLIVPPEDMPYTSTGETVDILINPLCIPSRMTIGKILEIIAGKIAAITGEVQNATAFRYTSLQQLMNDLVRLGYHSSGSEVMYSGTTGLPMESMIFRGVSAYQLLLHQVEDKYQARDIGARNLKSGQPVAGRAKGGGLKAGETERLPVRRVPHVANDLYMVRSDQITEVVCKDCETRAVVGPGQVTAYCQVCNRSGPNLGSISTTVASANLSRILEMSGIEIRRHFTSDQVSLS